MWNSARLLLLVLWATAAQAQVTPLIFAREDIRIESPKIQQVLTAEKPQEAPPAHPPLLFNIEVRPEDALRLEYIHTLNSLTDDSGVMIAFSAPSVVALPSFKVPTPVDALFVLDNGRIEQILPNVVLSELTQEITTKSPIKGFLFLKAGTVAALGIRPNDVVSGKTFTPAPPLMH
jgi:uncharacterized membrane protein (UPF0127 family)